MKKVKFNWKLCAKNPFHLSLQDFEQEETFEILDVHPEVHLNYNISGSGYSRIGDTFFTMEAGDLMLNPPWELHGAKQISAGTKLCCLTIDAESLLKALQLCSDRLQTLFRLSPAERWEVLQDPALKQEISALFSTLCQLEHQDELLLRTEQWLLIQQIFFRILTRVPAQAKSAQDAGKIAPALELLAQKTIVTLPDAARACHLSVSRFSFFFQKIYHTSFKAYQMEQRLNRTAVKLRDGMPVKETAASENFFDTSYFVKCFVRKFGITPGKFQQTSGGSSRQE